MRTGNTRRSLVDEIPFIVEEAHKQALKVAAHAAAAEGVKNAVTAGVDSIEHGHRADREDLELMKAKRTFLVPTVGVIDASFERTKNEPMTPEQREWWEAFLRGIQQSVQQAMNLGVKTASGFDASGPARQERNADELVALTKRGLPPLEAIRAATLNAAELMNWQDRVGAIEAGKYADLVAVESDPLADTAVPKQVMKGGTVVKALAH
jgi:imidazolonepropionase-like amidohydrolase